MKESRVNSQSGFTLIEIILVVSLMAVGYSILAGAFSNISDAAVQKLGRISSDVRAAFDTAVLTGKPHRLVFELGSGDYWLEYTENRDAKLADAKIDHDPGLEEQEDELAAFEARFENWKDLAAEPVIDPETDVEITPTSPVIQAKDKLKGPVWHMVKTLEWGKRSIADELIIKQFQAEHHERPIDIDDQGIDSLAFLYFLPNGYVEKAYMHVYYRDGDYGIDQDRTPYTVLTSPREGIARVVDGIEEVSLEDNDRF